jgi:PAS domain S-box-containing protein
MRDEDKTREELLSELCELRRRMSAFDSDSVAPGLPGKPHLDEFPARFRPLHQDVPLPYQSLDENGAILGVNQPWLESLGYAPEEVIGRNFSDFLHPDCVEHFHVNFPRFKAAGKSDGVEFEMLRKDGSIITVSFNGRISRDPGGRFRQAYCIFQDITDRRQTAEALRQSEELFRNIFEHHAAVKLIIDPDTGEIHNANKAAECFYGWTKEQLKRMTIQDINLLSPGQVKSRMNEAKHLERVHFEFRHRLADGSLRDVEVLSSKIQVHEKALLHSIVHDITDRKMAERLLRESEERYHQLFDNIKDAVYVHLAPQNGMPGRFIEVNEVACDRLGYTREELLTMTPSDIDAPDTLPAVPAMMEQLLLHGHATWEGAHMTRDAQRVPVEISNRLLHFRGLPMVLATARDISDRKEAEEKQALWRDRLNQAQKMESVGRLAGGVAHDFNNMLSVIIGHAEMALDEIDPNHELFTDLTEIMKAAERSADLTNQLLAFARKQTIAPRVLDLNETVEGMLKMLRRLIGEDIDLAWLPAGSLWPIKVDPGQIDQILANLCVNARDAISGVGRLTIETATLSFDNDYCTRHPESVPGDFVMLAVSDDGCGMDKETMGKIFEPFYTTKGVGEGTGLGLATVYGIVRQNNGFINVYSELGHGTTFKVYIPRSGERPAKGPAPFSDKDLRGRETVLLVEDEEAILAMGKTILQRAGYEVLAAKTPTEALGIVQIHDGPIHLLVTDVIMPLMNGKDLRDRLAEIRPDLKTIFMSGYTANVIAHHTILEEGIDFLQKPFSVKTLLEKVRDVLQR